MRKFLLIFVCIFLLKPGYSHSLVEIDITRGNLDPLPISISPFLQTKLQMQKLKKN